MWVKNGKSGKKMPKDTMFIMVIYDGQRAELRQKPGPPPSLPK